MGNGTMHCTWATIASAADTNMTDPDHRWFRDPAKWAACGRLHDLGACIGKYNDVSEHVEIIRRADGMPIEDADIPGIVADINILEDARNLDLSEGAFGDRAAIHLGQLRTVKALYLSGSKLTDAGVPHIAAIPTLQELVLSGTEVSDAGLVALEAAKGLRFLQLFNTRASEAGIAQLMRVLPQLHVERR